VGKYQRAETIYKRVLEIFDSCARYAGEGAASGGRCEIILFTSASGGTGCSTSAAACAVRLARSGKPALYLNLEPLGDSGAFFSGEGRTDLSDIIFALKSSAANLPVKLEIGARRDASGVFFFAPPRTALDISELDGGDIDALAARLRESGMFEYVVADAPLAPGRLAAHVMRHAQKVVFVSDGSDMCERKMAAARRVLEIMEGREEGARVPPVYVLYNKLAGGEGVRSAWDGARVLGGTPRCAGADTARVVRLLSESDVFDELTGAGASAAERADGWRPGRR
jgi:cellulose biosynthesis protein BcsQ